MGNDNEKHRDAPLIITPGGPKNPDKVHTVKPGKHIEINPDGTYSIVPDLNTCGTSAPPGQADKR